MAVYAGKLFFLRLALPLALAAGHASRFIKAVLVLSLAISIAQLVFQITLLSLHPYGSFLKNCEPLEQSLRHLGLVRLDGISAQAGVCLLLPDVLVVLASFATHLIFTKLPEPSNSADRTENPSPAEAAIFGPRFIHFLGALGKYIVLAALCLAGAARPSVPGAIYYASFIFWATWWAWQRNLGKAFARTCQVALAPLAAIHILVLFAYQAQWPQLFFPPDHQIARLMGLTALVTTSCDDPRSVTLAQNMEWSSFANPFLLLLLYFSLVFESQILLSSPASLHGGTLSPPRQRGLVSWNGAVRGAAASLPPSSPPRSSHPNPSDGLSRRRTIPWSRAASIRVRGRHVVEIAELKREEFVEDKVEIDYQTETGYAHLCGCDEGTPLMHSGRVGRVGGTRKPPGSKYNATGASVRLKKGATSSLTQDATGSVIWAHTTGPDGTDIDLDKNTEDIHMQRMESGNFMEQAATGIEDIEMESGPLEQIVDAIISVFQIITRSSYIATNIIMMAWSITYHSWLTFVLLLWASVLWMIPNQRRSLLHCSPFLVAYAELLLVAQYVYGMNLTDEELPPSVEGINLAQIGFIKPKYLPFKPILIKSLYTVMFWITLRQYSQERWELKNAASTVVGVTAEPFVISVTTATSQEIPPESANDLTAEENEGLMHKVGAFLKSFLTKFWIWVVAIMLCVIGLGGSKVVVYRIVYMALFLIFVLTFQMSYAAWRKMMYGFWLTVIVYSMLCLVLIYTYQFDNFPDYWKNYTGIPVELQHDIGLEVFDTGALFVRLLTPTFFVIITVIQLHYFHKDFLAISDIRHRNTVIPPEINTVAPDDEGEDTDGAKKNKASNIYHDMLTRVDSQKHEHNLSFKEMRKISYVKLKKVTRKSRILMARLIELLWKFFELHMVKIVFLSFVLMAVYDVCALHLAFVVLSVVALPCGKRIQTIIIHLSSALTSVLFLSKMIYQIEYIRHEQWEANCTGLQSLNSSNIYVGNVQFSMNNADWIGFKKTSRLPELLKGYIGLTLVCTLYAVVCTRQKHVRRALGVGPTPPTTPISSASMESSSYWARQERNILFPGVDRAVADNDICTCIKFLFNYGFYKFGVEICLITTVAVIGTRMDISSIIYSIWLCRLVYLSGRMGRGPKGAGSTGWGGGREALARVWILFLLTIAILLPTQYILAVGLPPGLCVDYPWYLGERLRRLQEWMFLPDYVHSPRAYKLVCDFILLLMVCQQYYVFKAERGPNSISHPGGSNRETSLDVDDPGLNPVPDFISNVRSWLDIVKRVVLSSFFWISLAVVFSAGTNRVNLFALGYLAGSFIFLWQGNDFYLRPMNSILGWWNLLLGYNVAVILFKSIIQMLGCVFIRDLQLRACWLVQLLGIACIKKFRDETILAGVIELKECVVPREDTGLAWDGVCFAFLLLQRRLFRSHYFLRVVDETKAQTILASRGAELIEELSKRQITEQQDLEHQVLEKIKHKMERIKATHQRRQETFLHEPTNHYDVQPSPRLSSSSSPVKVSAMPTNSSPPQGFHTPIEDDGSDTAPPSPTPSVSPCHPVARPFGGLPLPPKGHRRSLSQTMQATNTNTTTTNTSGAPTPSSAAFTISLDGYLEGQRISISSPLSSDMVLTPRRHSHRPCQRPRPASFPPPPNGGGYYGAQEEDDESFPVFSPPPYDAIGGDHQHHGSCSAGPRDGRASSRRSRGGASVSVGNPPIGPPWLPPPGRSSSISPAQSHHTCELIGEEYKMWQEGIHRRSAQDAIRSGDYFMFEEYDDEEEEMGELRQRNKRSIEEEEDEDEEGDVADGDNGSKTRRRRFTLSKLLSSAMKTDVGQAADMALMSHQEYPGGDGGEEVVLQEEGGEGVGDEPPATSSWRKTSLGILAPDGVVGLARQRSHPGLRSRRSSSLSADHNLQQPSSSVSVRSSFQSGRIPPLSEEEEPQVGSASSTPTHGKAQSAATRPAGKEEPPSSSRDHPGDPGDGGEGGDGVGDMDVDAQGAVGRRIWAFMKFFWALIESLMVSATQWLNRFSRDYRYIARCLTREKKLLKEKSGFREGMRTGSAMIWEPRPIVVASWKTRSGIYQEGAGKSSCDKRVNPLVESSRSKIHNHKGGANELDWESDDNITEERQRVTSETGEEEEEEVEKEGVPKILIWSASLDEGMDDHPPPLSQGSGSPALVSLEALEAEERRKEDGPAEEATTLGGPRSPIGCLLLAVWYAIISHSELVCYFTVFLHQIKSASLLSIPLPLMVFLWGTLSVPRPSKTFWVTIIAYTEVMVMIKCMFQFDYLPWNQQAVPENVPFFPPRIIGIERKKRYAIFDLTLLLVVFFHRFMLKSLGLWKSTTTCDIDRSSMAGEETTSITDSPSKSITEVRNKSITGSVAALEKSTLSETETDGPTTRCADLMVVRTTVHENLQHFPRVVCLAASKYLSSIKYFLFQLLEPTTRVTADVYAYMFMCDFFNIVVVIFGFASFGTQQGDGGVTAYIEENKVPVPFLVMLILQFALMVVDRALFLRKFILGKILFQILLVVGVHIWMFIVLPGVTERQFNASLPPQIWYVVKCIYLLLSAYQIRSGYPTRILGNFLCKKYNYVNLFLFKGFMLVPFLFELRTVMDWIWTDTSMTLSDWLKLEDIFSHIFQSKCHRRAEKEYPQPRGQKKRPLIKYLLGGIILILIIAIIWFPLVLFALGGTVGEPNLPNDVSFELRVGAYQPVFRMSAQNNSLLWFTENTWNSFGSVYKKDRVAQTFLSNYDWKDVAVAKLSGSSIATWTVSPPGKSQMIQEVLSDKPILVTLTWTISRKPPKKDTSGISTDSHTITMDPFIISEEPGGKLIHQRNPMRDRLAAMLSGNASVGSVILQSVLPKFLKVSNKGTVTPVSQLMRRTGSGVDYGEWWGRLPDSDGYVEGSEFRDLTLNLRYGSIQGIPSVTEWWELGEICSDNVYAAILTHLPFHDPVNQSSGECDLLTVYTFNDKSFPGGFFFSFISGAGIIGLYTSMVILLSKFSRGFFTGIAERIMFEDMPYVDRILQLCLDIYLVRESGELDLEEDLFAKLVFLYRSPETLIKWTRPKGEAVQPSSPQAPPQGLMDGPSSPGTSGLARRPEEDGDDEDDDDEDDDDDDDAAAALALMEDGGGAVAPRAQPERS